MRRRERLVFQPDVAKQFAHARSALVLRLAFDLKHGTDVSLGVEMGKSPVSWIT